MKKTLAFLLLYTSISVILINQIIPHHHHNTEICYEQQTSCSEIDKSQNSPAEKNNNEDNCALCGIFRTLIVPGDQVEKSQFHIPVIPLNDFYGHFAILNDEYKFDINPTPRLINCFPDLPLLKKSVHHSSGGFRAPPLSA